MGYSALGAAPPGSSGNLPQRLPLRERSLEIFGHEKKLDELLGTPVFADDRVTLNMLAAYVVHPPFVWQRITGAASGELLVVENHNTYDSIACAAIEHTAAGRPVDVAYGAGNAFEASVTYVASLDPLPTRVRYFGDLDAEGISIPTRASARAVAAGLPHVEPHLPLYELLLEMADRSQTLRGQRPRGGSGRWGRAPVICLPARSGSLKSGCRSLCSVAMRPGCVTADD